MAENMNLEETLKAKLERGEITQEEYDNLLKKFGDLDLLGSTVSSSRHGRRSHSPRHDTWSIRGSATRDGGEISEDVRVSGRLTVLGDLKCPSMKISGSASIDGDLTVVDLFKVSGAMSIDGVGKFGGYSKVSGKLSVKSNVYFTSGLKVSGKTEIGGDFIIGEDLKISGKLESNSVQSKALITLSGAMVVTEDVIANEFVSSGGKSDIGGNLEAQLIEIAKKYRERYQYNNDTDMDTDDIDSLPDLGKFISNIVTKVLPGMLGGKGGWGEPSIFRVRGNVIGASVDLSYADITGDIEANDVIIGPNVVVNGVIKYRNSIEVPEGHNYNIEKID